MTVHDVRMMICDSCATRYDLASDSWTAREAREDAAGRGWSHDLDASGERIDLCESCTDQREADGMRTGAGGEPEPEPRGMVTLTYMRDPRVYCVVNLDDGAVESVWSHNDGILEAPKAERADDLGEGLSLADFNDALAIAEGDVWPSWS
jgi:hypothetical protein